MFAGIIKPKGVWKFTICDAKTGKIKRVYEAENLIPTVGRTAMAAQLASTETNDMEATYIAYGDDNTAAANTDTTLGNEVYRKAVSSATNSNNVAYISGFLTASEDNDTYEEFGIFGDGSASTATGSADTGILYSRVVQQITKTNTETLTVTWTITFD